MIDFEKAQKIHKRMEEHLQPVLKSHKEWVAFSAGIAKLQPRL